MEIEGRLMILGKQLAVVIAGLQSRKNAPADLCGITS